MNVKPRILISKCFFESCRYNGVNIHDDFILKLADYVEFIKVCPEVEIGLGIPRKPIRIIETDNKKILYQPATEKEFTKEITSFTKNYLDKLENIDGFIMKYRSPTCGISHARIYTSFDPNTKRFNGKGFFGGEIANRFENYPMDHEGRLRNFSIREFYLTAVFTYARFRKAKEEGNINALIDFHTKHKYLFMAYNQSKLRALGKVLAKYNKKNYSEISKEYEELFYKVFNKMPKDGSIINVLLHEFGGFKDKLSKEEKEFFINSIEEYRDERIPLSVLLHILKSWAIRFNNKFLMEQIFMNPYPSKLVEITDSGKGRNN